MLLHKKKPEPRRHKGVAFLITVLISFALLAVVSAVVVSMNWSTLRAEGVLTGKERINAGMRGDMLACSLVITAAEILSADVYASSITGTLTSNTMAFADGDTRMYSRVKVKKESGTDRFTITAEVSTENGFPSDKAKTCSKKAEYKKGRNLVWRD